MNYFSEIQNIIDEMNNRLDVSIVLDRIKASKLVDYLIDEVIDGIRSEWCNIDDGMSIADNEEDIMTVLDNSKIVVLSKYYDYGNDREIYILEPYREVSFNSDAFFVDSDIATKINFKFLEGKELVKVIKAEEIKSCSIENINKTFFISRNRVLKTIADLLMTWKSVVYYTDRDLVDFNKKLSEYLPIYMINFFESNGFLRLKRRNKNNLRGLRANSVFLDEVNPSQQVLDICYPVFSKVYIIKDK